MLNKLTSLFDKKSEVVGIEINSQQINIAQIAKQAQQYKLIKKVSALIPEGVYEEGEIVDSLTLSELIKETLNENKIKAKEVVTSVPMREAILRIIPVPAELDEEELKNMVMVHEASMYLPYPREEVDLDYLKLDYFMDEDGIEKVNVLLVATRREITDLYLEIFQQAELGLKVLEINSFAMIRTIKERLRQYSPIEAVTLVDIQFESTEIGIIIQGVPHFSRTVPIGTNQMEEAILDSAATEIEDFEEDEDYNPLEDVELMVSLADGEETSATEMNPEMSDLIRILGELIEEVGRSINFFLNQREELEIAQILVAGPGSVIRDIDKLFLRRLNVQTTLVDPISALSIQVDEKMSALDRCSSGVVLGLGIRDLN